MKVWVFFFFFSLSLLTNGTAVAEELRVAGNPHSLSATGSNNDCNDASFILGRLFIGFKVLLYLFPQKHLTMGKGIVILEIRAQKLND